MRLGVAGAVVCTLLLAACGGGGGASRLSAGEIVSQTTAKTAAVKSFHFALKVANAPASSTGLSLAEADGDLAVPDRLKAKIKGTLAGIPLESELVVIGSRDFLKDPLTHQWRTVDLKTTPLAFFDPRQGVLAILKGATALTTVDEQKVGGVDTYHLKGKVRARQVAALLGNAASSGLDGLELWVGKRDLILRRIRVTEPGGASRTVEISAPGEHVTVVPPTASG